MARSRRTRPVNRRKRRNKQSWNLSTVSGNVVFGTPKTSTIRRASPPALVPKGAVDAGLGVFFEVGSVINWSEISALYDQYCITKAQVVFELATPFISNGVYPYVTFAPDYTDAVAPISASQALELANSKVFQFTPDHTRLSITLKPKPALAAYQSAVASGYAVPTGDTWFASDNSTVDHYGVKLWFNDYNTTISNITAIRYFVLLEIKVRSTR